MKNVILFGAGEKGICALKRYGTEKVAYFCDNDVNKHGTYIQGILVIDFDTMCNFHEQGYFIVITPNNHWTMVGQLELKGIYDYAIFQDSAILHLENVKQYDEYYKAENSFLDKYVEACEDIDLPINIRGFRDLVKELLAYKAEKGVGLLLRYGIKGGESNYYGNLDDLLDYSGLANNYNAIYAPHISHYDSCPNFYPLFHSSSAMVFSGDYYARQMHARFPHIPVFTVGPYLHYSKSLYDSDRIKEIRKQYGKTLLVYLPHSIESVDRPYDKNTFIDDVLRIYKNQFDTILLCVYWADMLDPVCDYAQEKGIQIVSNGFRFDNKFNRRQKSLMQIADAFVCGDIGTHLGFAIYMGII